MERYPSSWKPRNITKSQHKQSTQEIFWKGQNRKVDASARARNSKEMTRSQDSHRVSLGTELSRMRIVRISSPVLGLFTLYCGGSFHRTPQLECPVGIA